VIKKTVGEDNKAANLMAHAVVNAALSLAKGENALAGASSAATAEAVGMISKAYYGKDPSELDESQKQTISALASLAAGLAGGLVGGDTASAVSGMQTGKVTVENNSLSEAADYLATGKKPEDRYRDAQNQLKDAVNEFKAKNCAGLDAGACRVKMESHRDELLKGFGKATLDFVPIIGTIKTFAEAESALDYLYAAATIIPGERIVSGILKSAEKALRKGDVTEASRLINKASNEVGTAKYFGQDRKFWSAEPIEFSGNKVYQRNDLFNPQQVSSWKEKGKTVTGTNIERMASGRAL